MKYQKSRISINEQIALLTENKGLECSDQSELERALVEANHYRLSAYWFPYKNQMQVRDYHLSRRHNIRNHHLHV